MFPFDWIIGGSLTCSEEDVNLLRAVRLLRLLRLLRLVRATAFARNNATVLYNPAGDGSI